MKVEDLAEIAAKRTFVNSRPLEFNAMCDSHIDALIEVARAAKVIKNLCEDGYSDIGEFAKYDSLVRALSALEAIK